jgi:hypothetical protein
LRAALVLASLGAHAQNAAVPIRAEAPVGRREIDACVDRGVKFLVDAAGESNGELRTELRARPGESGLLLYTLLHCGIDRGDPLVRRLLLHLAQHPCNATYDAACVLLALAAHDPIAHRPWIDDLARELVAAQAAGGAWSYGKNMGGSGDLSNTQYAALGLHAAARAGAAIPREVWERLGTAVLRFQDARGGFGYVTPNGTPTGSMTAAGVGTLAICEIQLRTRGAFGEPWDARWSEARARGVAWLASNFSVSANPGHGGWLTYYLYGLERLGAFTGSAQVGSHDWYQEGAEFLVRSQDGDGAWEHGSELSDSCFALLFLRRASFADHRVPETGVASAEREQLRLATSGDAPLVLRLDGWSRKFVRDLEWPGERGRGPHVARVEYFDDGTLIAVALADASRPSAGASYAAAHLFERAGKHRLTARAWVRPPPNGDERVEYAVESPAVEVEIARALPSWLAQSAGALAETLSALRASARATAEASPRSTPMGIDASAAFAIDGNPRTAWLAEAKPAPTLRVHVPRGVRCSAIRLRPPDLPFADPSALAQIVEVGISVDGAKPRSIVFAPEPLRPVTLRLERPDEVHEIEIEIRSTQGDGLVGLGEVELLHERK